MMVIVFVVSLLVVIVMVVIVMVYSRSSDGCSRSNGGNGYNGCI